MRPMGETKPPESIEEGAERLLALMSVDAKAELAGLGEEDLFQTHFGLGMFARNALSLWKLPPLSRLGADADDVSAKIIRAAWLSLRGSDPQPAAGAERPRTKRQPRERP
jgi:hypothetical protein